MKADELLRKREGLVDIYAFEDYRAFLGETYRSKKKTNPHFSYRAFAKRTGFSAPNHLQRVIAGQRNLSPDAVERYASALHLDQDETAFFRLLVSLGQEEEEEDRERLRRSLQALRNYRSAQRLGDAHARYHHHWYIPAIFEMIACAKFREHPAWIAEQLWPKITEEEAQSGLDALHELGLIEEEEGRLKQTNATLTTGAEAQKSHIADYHRVMMQRASSSIEAVPSEQRDISSLTVSLGAAGLSVFKKRIQEFRRELLSLAEGDEASSQVVQLNLQLFPLTKNMR